MYVDKNEWKPMDGFTLEDAAMRALKSECNTLVIAGPGSGKTELLAQKACYLLQTNQCQNPCKILAISFKKDSATNLAKRVKERMQGKATGRFSSLTFDGFFKGVVDRFLKGLPEKDQYEIECLIEKKEQVELKKYRDKADSQITNSYYKKIQELATKVFSQNPLLKDALCLTYSHVFVDEFQDTTKLQYDFLLTCFANHSLSVNPQVTVVGDNKQSIMRWAGAIPEIFQKFSENFQAEQQVLLMNHRSAPKLVDFQKSLYEILNEPYVNITHSKPEHADDSIRLYSFSDTKKEAEIISDDIQMKIANGVKPNDICILVKQLPGKYVEEIRNHLETKSIRARIEVEMQDLLVEPLIQCYLNILGRIVSEKKAIYSDKLIEIIDRSTDGDFDYDSIQELTAEVGKNLLDCKNKEEFSQIIVGIQNNFGGNVLSGLSFEYNNKAKIVELCNKFIDLFWNEFLAADKSWKDALDNFIGENSIPIMTIHKSKGLEFDSVYFIGLEDSAFWNFREQPLEDKCAFFVALSRAKKSISFTYSATRDRYSQNRHVIHELYVALENSEHVEQLEFF